jgi:type II secretory pathway component PulF
MFVSSLFRINKAHGREFIFTAATALAADVPLQPALLSLAAPSLVDCFPGRVRRVIRALDEGRPLSWALDRHLSAWCPKHWAPAIAQAEEMGHLPDTLNILASQTGSSHDDMLRGRLRQFTAYLVGFITIISGLLIFIMPKFAKIFDEMAGAPLPASTEFLFYFSDVIRSSGLLPLIFFLPFVISGIIRGRMANLLIQLPILGRATRLEAAQQSARSLATALRGSVDMVTRPHHP